METSLATILKIIRDVFPAHFPLCNGGWLRAPAGANQKVGTLPLNQAPRDWLVQTLVGSNRCENWTLNTVESLRMIPVPELLPFWRERSNAPLLALIS